MTKAQAIEPIERVSGLPWSAWLALFDAAGGDSLDHTALARVATDELRRRSVDKAEWWGQGVAVAFEQHLGRRVPGQRSDGSFETSVSKTLGRDLDAALAAWSQAAAEAPAFGARVALEAPSVTATEAWRYWRVTFDDGSKLTVMSGTRPNGAAYVSAQHAGLANAEEVPLAKAHWRAVLERAAALAIG